MWSFDGETLVRRRASRFPFRLGERVRVNLINDTMMPHPIHLHGHFFELVTGEPGAPAAQAHGQRPARRQGVLRPDRRCAGRLGVPLPHAAAHARRHDAGGHRRDYGEGA